MTECSHVWRDIPCGQEKCDSCGMQRDKTPEKGYSEAGIAAAAKTTGTEGVGRSDPLPPGRFAFPSQKR